MDTVESATKKNRTSQKISSWRLWTTRTSKEVSNGNKDTNASPPICSKRRKRPGNWKGKVWTIFKRHSNALQQQQISLIQGKPQQKNNYIDKGQAPFLNKRPQNQKNPVEKKQFNAIWVKNNDITVKSVILQNRTTHPELSKIDNTKCNKTFGLKTSESNNPRQESATQTQKKTPETVDHKICCYIQKLVLVETKLFSWWKKTSKAKPQHIISKKEDKIWI